MDAAVDQQARAGVAHLAHVGIDALVGGSHGTVEVGDVGHEHLRRLATAFERDPLHVRLPGVLQDQLADLGGTGEGNLGNVGMQRERLARHFAQAIDHVQHTWWPAGLREQCRQPQTAQRGLLGGLQDDRVARGERRRDLPHGHQQRVIPRRDRADDAQRLAQYHVHDARFGVGHRALELVDAFGHEADGLDHRGQVDADDVGDGLAHVEGLEHRQRLRVAIDELREAVQHLHALPRRHARPDAGAEGALRRSDRPVDVCRGARRHLGQRLAGRGIQRGEAAAARGIDECAVDEEPRLEMATCSIRQRVPVGAVMI